MKKHNRWITLLAAALMVCLLLVGCGKEKIQPTETQNTEPVVEAEVTATNEQELRQYLAADTEQVIHVSGEMVVSEGFVVNGSKTLTGNLTVTMELGAELGQPLLKISEGSSLTVDGPVLDCNYNADGIYVSEKAELKCLSGKIRYAGAYGIITYGNVDIEDISIEDCEYISICAQTGSSVDMKGGNVLRSSSNDIFVVTGASAKVGGQTLMEGALEHGIINYGTLEITGGKYGNVNNYLCDNYGELTVCYKGDQKDGKIEFYGTRNSVFLIRKGSTANISNVFIHDTQRQGIASLGGDTVITDCVFENTGNHSIDIQGGKATVSDIVITGSKGSGMEASNASVVEVKNFTVNSCDKIGIASRGAKINASDITISNTGKYGMSCGSTKTGHGFLTVDGAVLTGNGMHGLYVYEKARAEVQDLTISGGKARGIYTAATASCVVSGNSSIKGMEKGGIEVRGNLRIENVLISENRASNSGVGVYVADGGAVTMNGGVICNNSSALRGAGVCVSNASFTMNGGKIYSNHAANHGGGLYAQKKAVVVLRDGSMYNNTSSSNGDGVYILNAETQVTMAGSFYMGDNDVKVDNASTCLTITRDALSSHSKSDPLLLTPNYNAPEGTVVATCKSASAAKKILAATAPGDGSYELAQEGKNIVIRYAVADMDMTGADTVEVSNFTQLKKAIETADTKRNIILKADIVFPQRIRFPGGVTIKIQDDGTKRTLTRADGFTDSFFVTHYGTGLYLTGTAADMLVIDGSSNVEKGTKLQSLIRAAGSTEIRNTVLRDNGSALKEHDVRGAFVRQIYGNVKIYDSTLTGGTAYSGGALLLENAVGYVENCSITDNQSTIGGGAIRVNAGCELEIVDSRLAENDAGSTGGAIVAVGAAKVSAANTAFINNTAAKYGGAVSAQDADTKILLTGTDGNAVFKNNCSETAGAIYAVKGVHVTVDNYTFEANAATSGRAGAVSILDNSSAIITGSVFRSNTATASAGAVSVDGSAVQLSGCTFDCNLAGDKAGAILAMSKATVEMTGNGTVSGNVASGTYGGGAVYVDETSTLKVSDHTITGNDAASGGAIYMAAGANVEGKNNQFLQNKATTGNGGAIYCAGTYTDTNSSYENNSAKRNGGAVIVMSGGNAAMTGTTAVMKGNSAELNNGGAVFVNGGGAAAITGYTLENNSKGAVQIQVNASADLKDVSMVGTGSGIYVNGSLAFDNLTGVHIYQTNTGATITVDGFGIGNMIALTPKTYETGKILTKGKASAAEFKAACENITVAEGWYIEDGILKQIYTVSILAGETTEYFPNLKEAVAFANTLEDPAEIRVLDNIYITSGIVVDKTVTICNAEGKSLTITRGANFKGDLFTVNGNLTIDGITVDGTSVNAVSGRTITVNSGAQLTLKNNAIVQNALSSAPGAALDVQANATVTIDNAKFINNQTKSTGGAIRINPDATVESRNAEFNGNKSWLGSTYSNGGAIWVGGKFTDENSKYIGNEGKNGAAIFLGAATADVTLIGTDGMFQNNLSTGDKNSRGGAIFANGGTVTVDGYTFEGNTSTGTNANAGNGAIHIASGSATLKNIVFQGEVAQKIYMLNQLTIENLTGADIVQVADKTITVTGTTAGTNIRLTPVSYTEDKLILTGTADFSGVQVADGWYIGTDGKLKQTTPIKVIVGDVTENFRTLDAAVAYANGQTGSAEIQLPYDVTLNATCEITGNITICGNGYIVARGAELTGDMFVVSGNLTIDGITVDGTSVNAVSGRTITVNSGAQLTLKNNAIVQNALSSAPGAALDVQANATVTIDNAKFINNQTKSTGGAIRINPDATVESRNAEFNGNKSWLGSTYSNGGAIWVGGKFTDENSKYIGNEGKNGAAIFLGAATADVTLIGTDGMFQNNLSTGDKNSRGGAIFANGGTVTVDGYTFEGNTSTGTNANAGNGAIHIASGSATLKNIVFQGEVAQKIYMLNQLTIENLTGADIVQVADKTITVTGTTAGTNIRLTPVSYTEDKLILTGTADFSGVQVADGWYIGTDGKLKQTTSIKVTVGSSTEYFKSLDAAIAYANGQTGATEIQLLSGVTLNSTCEITGNVTISGNAAITRGAELTDDMFVVSGNLTIGSGVTVDGGDTAVAGRSVTVNSGATFTLASGAIMQNANSTVTGGALQTAGTTYLYGTLTNNASSKDGAAVEVAAGTVTIRGATFSNNVGGSSCSGAALCIRNGATVTSENATFANNTVPASKNGGAIYVAGTFNDTNSTYTGNVAKNGGAIFLGASTANVTLIGTNGSSKFENNQAVGAKGGALYNNGGTLNVDGYTFTNNTCKDTIPTPTDLKNAQIWSAKGTTTLTNNTLN